MRFLTRLGVAVALSAAATGLVRPAAAQPPGQLFESSDRCIACHNGVKTPSGEDISFGKAWRGTMMANSSRDPYWHAGVRREVIDHPSKQAEIEDECSICHMPMATFTSRASGGLGVVFSRLPAAHGTEPVDVLAADGASCTVCHQISAEGLGTPESFTGGFKLDAPLPEGHRHAYGPYDIDAGRKRVMSSATGFAQSEATHIRQSELCATCHTLYTHALNPDGSSAGQLPEQVPYLEWRASDYRSTKSCQGCHMPVVEEATAVSSTLGQLRDGAARHLFKGGNFFIPRLLDTHREELAVTATPTELQDGVSRTIDHLQQETATVRLEGGGLRDGRIFATVAIENLAGHKFPTAYPARRAWLHIVVRDAAGQAVFESGALQANGSIAGNDNDADGSRFEPHYQEITAADQVQVYESVMVDPQGRVTTGLLSGVRYIKDNRLLPHGFDKNAADPDVAVHGDAMTDSDFTAGGDRLRIAVPAGARQGPFTVDVELYFQPIAYRWAHNLEPYAEQATEPAKFLEYYEGAADRSAVIVARATATVR